MICKIEWRHPFGTRSSTNALGGNQVDGLPPASSWKSFFFEMFKVISFLLSFNHNSRYHVACFDAFVVIVWCSKNDDHRFLKNSTILKFSWFSCFCSCMAPHIIFYSLFLVWNYMNHEVVYDSISYGGVYWFMKYENRMK